MKLQVFVILFLALPIFSSTKFLQLFDTLSSENAKENGFHEPVSNSPPSLIEYLKDGNNTSAYSFKQIPDEIPRLSIKIPDNDDYMKGSFAETNVNVESLEKQAEKIINRKGGKKKKNLDMGHALEKTRDFIEKAIKDDLSVGVSKTDLMNLLSFSNKILEKCNGDFLHCSIEKKEEKSSEIQKGIKF